MTLFDGQPITEEEVQARLVCVCTHTYAQHVVAGQERECTTCGPHDCPEFREVEK